MQDQTAKAFIADAKEKANNVLVQEHVGADVKMALKDLMQACDSLQAALVEMNDSSADSRLAKKKLEQARAETRSAEKLVNELKNTLAGMTADIKAISLEANSIIKRQADSPEAVCAKQILSAAQNMVKAIIAISSKPAA